MKKRKLWLVLCLTAMAAVNLTACGGNGKNSTTAPSSGAAGNAGGASSESSAGAMESGAANGTAAGNGMGASESSGTGGQNVQNDGSGMSQSDQVPAETGLIDGLLDDAGDAVTGQSAAQ